MSRFAVIRFSCQSDAAISEPSLKIGTCARAMEARKQIVRRLAESYWGDFEGSHSKVSVGIAPDSLLRCRSRGNEARRIAKQIYR
jgi:hypothetical protein